MGIFGGILYMSGFIRLEMDDEVENDKTESSDSQEFVKSDDHPGWLWDSSKEEWIPDPDYNE